MVLPGVVFAFILSGLLKKEGFCAAAKETVKANGATEESKDIESFNQLKLEEDTMMNVDTTTPVVVAAEKINGGSRCLSKELNGGCGTVCGGVSENMVEEEGGRRGGCGGCGGCGGGSGGGRGGGCGGMTKTGGYGGGSCTGGSTGCGNCGGVCGNMMNHANANVPLVVAAAPPPEALNDAVAA